MIVTRINNIPKLKFSELGEGNLFVYEDAPSVIAFKNKDSVFLIDSSGSYVRDINIGEEKHNPYVYPISITEIKYEI